MSGSFIQEGSFKCKCGKEFTKSQSFYAHQSHCKIHLGERYDESSHGDRIGDKRAWSRGLTKEDPVYGDSIKRCSGHRNKIPIEDILSNKVKGYLPVRLKWRLIEEGYKEFKCECCGLSTWLGKEIPLELHHKDGDNQNNELENLELLCPNCHSLTDNYRWKNTRKK